MQVHRVLASALGGFNALIFSLLIMVFTGFFGASLARKQGFETLTRLRKKLQQGQEPSMEMTEGLMIMVGGLLLLTPGYLSDAFGFSLVLPWTRKIMGRIFHRKIINFFQASVQSGSGPQDAGSNFFYQKFGGGSFTGFSFSSDSEFRRNSSETGPHRSTIDIDNAKVIDVEVVED